MAVDQNIDMTTPIRSYMNINRNCFGIWSFPEEPEDDQKDQGGGGGAKSTVANRKLPSRAPPSPAPPQLKTGSNRVANATASAVGDKKDSKEDSSNLMDAIKKAVEKGGTGLKKTDLNEDEREKRGMEPTANDSTSKLKKREIQELVDEGSKLWQKDESKFIEALQDALLTEHTMLNIVFQVVDNDMLEWKDAKKMMVQPLSDGLLSRAVLQAGLNLRYQVEDGRESAKEYIAIQCPAELPRWIVLKTIQSILSSNGVGEGPKAQGEVVQGYWSKKKNVPTNIGSLW